MFLITLHLDNISVTKTRLNNQAPSIFPSPITAASQGLQTTEVSMTMKFN